MDETCPRCSLNGLLVLWLLRGAISLKLLGGKLAAKLVLFYCDDDDEDDDDDDDDGDDDDDDGWMDGWMDDDDDDGWMMIRTRRRNCCCLCCCCCYFYSDYIAVAVSDSTPVSTLFSLQREQTAQWWELREKRRSDLLNPNSPPATTDFLTIVLFNDRVAPGALSFFTSYG